jgi:hypothetical protein
LCVRWGAGNRIGIHCFELRSIVGEVEQSVKRVNRPRATDEIVVVLFPSDLESELHRMIAGNPVRNVAKLEGVLREDGWRCFGAFRPKANAVKGQGFDLDQRNTKVGFRR